MLKCKISKNIQIDAQNLYYPLQQRNWKIIRCPNCRIFSCGMQQNTFLQIVQKV